MGDGGVSIEEGESEVSVTRLPPSRRWIQSWTEASSRIEPPWPSMTKLALTRSLNWLVLDVRGGGTTVIMLTRSSCLRP